MNCSFHNDSQMTLELDSFLKFEHDIGNLIFFEDVRNFIVLDPKWLMDTFRCFVSHQYSNESIGMPEWDDLERTGKLSDKLIEKLLEKVPDLNSPERKKFVLQIMEKFDIIVRPINNYAINDFYMPCMIKAGPFHNIIGKSESEDERKSSCGKRRHVIQLDNIPRKMDVVDKNTVAVLLKGDIVAIIDIQQNHVQYIHTIAMSSYMSGTSFIYIENELYIGNDYGIFVFDMSGNSERRITLSFTQCEMCYDVDSQRIYCIDSNNSQLICIDRDGNDIFTFTDPNMTNLTDLTIDNEGNVLVLCEKEDDNSGYSVVKVDSNGEKSEVVITNINTSRFDYPRICYDHLTDSVVIAVRDTVYIYKKNESVNI
ncbi:unnamed protein product [Mytilus edulis]|uniref:COR domain-containing protein n=1 Tax=Mytilus edulis TaxID=6550 RepID=A0A8S3PYD2_MYTED|nr:unnamed protein product [Mytilus edulis]